MSFCHDKGFLRNISRDPKIMLPMVKSLTNYGFHELHLKHNCYGTGVPIP